MWIVFLVWMFWFRKIVRINFRIIEILMNNVLNRKRLLKVVF